MTGKKSSTLEGIVKRFGGELVGDGATRIQQVAALESARSGQIAFLSQLQYLPQLAVTRASAVIVPSAQRDASLLPRIISDNPQAYFARVAEFFNPAPAFPPGIHRSAVIAKTARVPSSASLGPCVIIGNNVRLGARVVIGAGCSIGDGSTVGADTRLNANVTVYHGCRIGARCVIHSGAVIGADGFGIVKEAGRWKKVPQVGGTDIGDDVEIGANTTIDRGALNDTVLEEGVKLDNQIQIGHNVHIGAHTAIAACVGIAGSTKIGRHCAIGGAAMINGHITIGDNITISGGSVIMKSLREAGTYTGIFPSSSHQNWLKHASHLRHLGDLVEKIHQLEQQLATRKRKELS